MQMLPKFCLIIISFLNFPHSNINFNSMDPKTSVILQKTLPSLPAELLHVDSALQV